MARPGRPKKVLNEDGLTVIENQIENEADDMAEVTATGYTEVKHDIVQGTVEALNTRVMEWLNQGWKLIDVKIVSFELHGANAVMFYIFGR